MCSSSSSSINSSRSSAVPRADLVHDQIQRLLEREHKSCVYEPGARYVRHRHILVDWVVQVQAEYRLADETISLALNYMDRVLGHYTISRSQWQLVAIASIQIAAKYHERDGSPSVRQLMLCADNAYSREEVLQMERQVVVALSWTLFAVTPLQFIEVFCSHGLFSDEAGAALPSNVAYHLHNRIRELTFICQRDYTFNQWRPSVVASSVAAAARIMLELDPKWSVSRPCLLFSGEEVSACVQRLLAQFKHKHGLLPLRDEEQQKPSPVSVLARRS